MFEWLKQRPGYLKDFEDFMAGQRQDRIYWFDAYPLHKVLFDGSSSSDNESVLLVDMGGWLWPQSCRVPETLSERPRGEAGPLGYARHDQGDTGLG